MRYWIQDISKNGEYHDSIGFPPNTHLTKAISEWKSWCKTFPEHKSRLIERTDRVIRPIRHSV